MNAFDYLVVVGGILGWLLFLVLATAIVRAIGVRRIADHLRLDIGDDEL